MPSNDSAPGSSSRRRFLAAAGTAAVTGTAGCSGRLPGTGPSELTVESSVEDDRILWRYPRREGDDEGIGYAAVSIERRVENEYATPALRLQFNSTVGRLAASDPYRGYHPDWFRFSVRPPRSYDGRLQYQLRVEPPGQWEGFGAYYDVTGGVKRSVVELRNLNTQGTIIVPAVFDPGQDSLPDRLFCTFTVQASRSGVLGKTVRASGSESIGLESE